MRFCMVSHFYMDGLQRGLVKKARHGDQIQAEGASTLLDTTDKLISTRIMARQLIIHNLDIFCHTVKAMILEYKHTVTPAPRVIKHAAKALGLASARAAQ